MMEIPNGTAENYEKSGEVLLAIHPENVLFLFYILQNAGSYK